MGGGEGWPVLTVLPHVRGTRRMNHFGHFSFQIDSFLFESLINQIYVSKPAAKKYILPMIPLLPSAFAAFTDLLDTFSPTDTIMKS